MYQQHTNASKDLYHIKPRPSPKQNDVKFSNRINEALDGANIKCDICVQPTVAKAFCSDCYHFLCQRCLDLHNSDQKWRDHHPDLLASPRATTPSKESSLSPVSTHPGPAPPPPLSSLCPNPDHKNRRLKFYCEKCAAPVCFNCLHDKHSGHAYRTLSSETGDHAKRLRETVEAIHGMLAQLKAAISGHDNSMLQVESSKVSAITYIVTTFRELQHSLERRRQVLLDKVERVAIGKRALLALKREELQRMEDELGQYSEASLSGSNVGRLDDAMRKVTAAQERYAHDVAPSLSTTITSSLDTGWLMDRIDHFGIVEDCSPQHSVWKHKSPPTINHPYVLQVQTKDSKGAPKRVEDADLRVELRDKNDCQHVVSGHMQEDNVDGTYTVDITPPARVGTHVLSVTMNGQHICNSPWEQYIGGRSYHTLQAFQRAYSANQPHYVAVGDDGCMYVSSYRRSHHHGYIDILKPDGTRKLAIGCYGNNCGELDSPRGIAVKGDIAFVSDCGNHRVHKVTTDGQFLLCFGQPGSGEGQLKRPIGLCIDAKGRVIVADSGNHRIQIFDENGKYLNSIAGNTEGTGSLRRPQKDSGFYSPVEHGGTLPRTFKDSSFYSPYGVAVDPQGNIHVAANNTSAIKVFTSEGTFVRMYGNLSGPTGIAVDKAGFCIICQSSSSSYRGEPNCPVAVFDPYGNQIHTLAGVQGAYGVAVDKDNNILVADWIKNQVVLY